MASTGTTHKSRLSAANAPPATTFARLSMFAFVALGLPDGIIGTVWPTLRRSFGVPLEDIGIVLLAVTAGSVVTASVSGLVLGRLGTRVTIITAATAAGLGALGAALSPAFWVFVVSGTLLGVAAGLLDSAVNTAVALAGRNRLLNLLHGCYGIGTTVGPLIVTAAILAGSWRPAYGALAVVEVLVVVGWAWAGRSLGPGSERAGEEATPVPPAVAPAAGPAVTALPVEGLGGVGRPALGRLRLGVVVVLGLLVFLVYCGMEVAAGQWEPSFDRGQLHMSAGATGLAVFGYWGALTLVRLSLAVPRRPLSQMAIVRSGCLVALAGAGLVWWGPTTVLTLIGFVIIGGALAGVFPALVVLTPRRVGEETARHVIGWQVGAAGVGGSVVSGLFGVIFQHEGLGQLGPALVVVGVLLVVGSEALHRLTASSSAPAS